MQELALAKNFAICPNNAILQGVKAMVSLNKKRKVIAFCLDGTCASGG